MFQDKVEMISAKCRKCCAATLYRLYKLLSAAVRAVVYLLHIHVCGLYEGSRVPLSPYAPRNVQTN